MVEVIQWISIVFLWMCAGFNLWVAALNVRARRKLAAAQKTLEHIHELYEGRPPVAFCYECRYFEKLEPNDKGFLICPASGMDVTAHDYCSFFDKKET